MKKLLTILVIIVGIFSWKFAVVQGATILFPYQGGTGLNSATAGDVGDCLTVSDDAPFTYTLGTCGAGSGGSNQFTQETSGLRTATSTDYVKASYFISTSTATSTFAGGIQMTHPYFLLTHGITGDASDGLYITANNGTAVANFGVGNSANSIFNGGVNIDGQTRLATSLTGLLKAVSGVVSVASSGSDYEVPLTVSNGLTRTVNNIAPTTGYTIPLTASTTNWNTFYDTPSTRITAGTNLSWAGNTLNATAGADGVSNWLFNGTTLTPSTTVGIGVFASSTVGNGTATGGLTISGGGTSTLDMSVNGLTVGKGKNSAIQNTAFGFESLSDFSGANGYSTAVGYNSLKKGTTGIGNTGIGYIALRDNTINNYSTAVGYLSSYKATGGLNTAIGANSFQSNVSGVGNVAIGHYAGAYELDSNTFYVNNQDQTDTAHDKSDSLMYGTFNATPASQTLNINASTTIAQNLTVRGIGVSAFSGSITSINATSSTSFFSALGTFTNLFGTNANLTYASTTGISGTNLSFTNSTTTSLYASGVVNLNSATVKQHVFKTFTWPGSPTTTTATNTVPLGTAYTAELWNGADCYTTSGSASLSFTDGTNIMNARSASTTVGRFTLSTNNTFTVSETRKVNIGALTASQLSCTIDITVNNN